MQMMKKISLRVAIGSLLLLLAACGSDSPDRKAPTSQAQTSQTQAGQTQAGQTQTSQAQPGQMQDEQTQGDSSSALTVLLSTNVGDIEIELDEEKAPLSVANFLSYVDSGHYAGTVFHRVIAGFMIQGGGFTSEYEQKATLAPVKNEATNGLKNLKYTIAMARTGVVDSATSQFFINVADNAFLDHRDTSTAGYGYAVFGRVVSGQEVVDAIAAAQTGSGGRFASDVPVDTVVIESITRQ